VVNVILGQVLNQKQINKAELSELIKVNNMGCKKKGGGKKK